MQAYDLYEVKASTSGHEKARVLHANYKTAREMERKSLQNPATNVDAAFAGARPIAAARTLPEAAQLYGKFVQQQWSAGSGQFQELFTLSQRSSTQTEATDRV